MDFEIYWTLIGGDTHFANRKPSAKEAWNAHPKNGTDGTCKTPRGRK